MYKDKRGNPLNGWVCASNIGLGWGDCYSYYFFVYGRLAAYERR